MRRVVTVIALTSLTACGSGSSRTSRPDRSESASSATTASSVATTSEAGTTSSTAPGTTITSAAPVITAPPGRLPAVDTTAKMTALFPTPFHANDPSSLATETINRLRSSFEAGGFSADVRGVSLVAVERSGRPAGSVMAYVVEVRNREASGNDVSPGYDLIITMERGDSDSWTITKAEEQEICSRGTSTISNRWVCV